MFYAKAEGLSHKLRLLVITAVMLVLFAGFSVIQAQEVTVTHNQGETVVPVNPQTVVVFDISTLSTLNALGIEVAGVPATTYTGSLEKYNSDDFAKVGSLFEPDYEAVSALAPDLIVVGGRSSAVYPQLSEIATTIDLAGNNADYLAAQFNNADILGQIFGKEAEVEAIKSEIEASIDALSEKTAEAGSSLIVMVSGGQITAYGTGSRFGWIHDELGFVPVIEDIQEATHGEAISFEFILEANPDWLIVIDRDIAVGQQGEGAAQVLDNELVAQTTAWQNGNVIYLEPSNWYIVMGGLGAIQEMVTEIGAPFGLGAATEVTVTHNQGETVVPVNPQTVVVFDVSTLSTLNALGIEVAGVPATTYTGSLEKYNSDDFAKVGSLFEPDYEAVSALAPDLIVVGGRSSAVYPQLSEIATTIDLAGNNADYLAAQFNNADILGQIFGKEAEVEALKAELTASIEALNEKTAEAGNALIVMVSGGQVTAYGTGSRFGWIHDELGFVPVIEDIQEATHGEAISFEFILEANPDWLIVIDRDIAVGQQGEGAAQVLDNELVAQTTAWQNGNVIYLEPSNWYIVMGGLGAIQEMVTEISAPFAE